MPVPTIADLVSAPSKQHEGQPSQKSMTKAERRELQEKQRAAKLVSKQQPQSGGAPTKAKSPQIAPKKQPGGESNVTKQHTLPLKDTGAISVADDAGIKSVSHGLRIFSHFGLPKPIGHTLKGDIHPAIIRLGLLFSEFRICGANARCIATLTAFKTVYSTPLPRSTFYSSVLRLLGDTRLYHTYT